MHQRQRPIRMTAAVAALRDCGRGIVVAVDAVGSGIDGPRRRWHRQRWTTVDLRRWEFRLAAVAVVHQDTVCADGGMVRGCSTELFAHNHTHERTRSTV